MRKTGKQKPVGQYVYRKRRPYEIRPVVRSAVELFVARESAQEQKSQSAEPEQERQSDADRQEGSVNLAARPEMLSAGTRKTEAVQVQRPEDAERERPAAHPARLPGHARGGRRTARRGRRRGTLHSHNGKHTAGQRENTGQYDAICPAAANPVGRSEETSERRPRDATGNGTGGLCVRRRNAGRIEEQPMGVGGREIAVHGHVADDRGRLGRGDVPFRGRLVVRERIVPERFVR